MSAANTDKVLKVGVPGTATTLAAPGHDIAGDSINVVSTTNWPTDTAVAFAMDMVELVEGKEQRVDGTYTEWVGVVDSSTGISDMVLTFGNDQQYPAGSLTRVYIPVTSTQVNRFAEAFLAQHKQNGSHGVVTADSVTAPVGNFTSLTVGGVPAADGWNPITGVPTIASAGNKGQREYDITWPAADLTSILSPGQKIKIPRSVAPATQCMDLESASSQFAQKSSPTGLAFTDDFTMEAWVKLESYTGNQQTVVGRYSGTGFLLIVNVDGQIEIFGQGASTRQGQSVTSIPLGRWVHIAATLDMSANTSTIYIDGVSVPVTMNGAGTSITQAGNLAIGSYSSGQYFDGKVSDVRVWSAVRTATQIRDNMNVQLVGNETNLVAYFKLAGNLNDSTANANNLTGSGGAVATTDDNPMKATEYGYIMNVAKPATDTVVTIFTGTDFNIPNQTLLAASYSTQAAPNGFPTSKNKWIVEAINMIVLQTAFGAVNQWADSTMRLTAPSGAFNVKYNISVQLNSNTPGGRNGVVTLKSTSFPVTNNQYRHPFICQIPFVNGSSDAIGRCINEYPVQLAAQENFTITGAIFSATGSESYLISYNNQFSRIYAECAYA